MKNFIDHASHTDGNTCTPSAIAARNAFQKRFEETAKAIRRDSFHDLCEAKDDPVASPSRQRQETASSYSKNDAHSRNEKSQRALGREKEGRPAVKRLLPREERHPSVANTGKVAAKGTQGEKKGGVGGTEETSQPLREEILSTPNAAKNQVAPRANNMMSKTGKGGAISDQSHGAQITLQTTPALAPASKQTRAQDPTQTPTPTSVGIHAEENPSKTKRPVMQASPDPSRVDVRHVIRRAIAQAKRVVCGHPDTVHLVFVAVLARGHVLIEDMPGVGKTTLARATATLLGLHHRRIQCTPDLTPADLTGFRAPPAWAPDSSQQDVAASRHPWVLHKGPLFTQVVLADELNRASPRTQSALLEAMAEQSVSIDGATYRLDSPFMVLATQNPRDDAGTHPLPRSQMDRFLFRLSLGYPGHRDEMGMLMGRTLPVEELAPMMTARQIVQAQEDVDKVHVSADIARYVVRLLRASRNDSSSAACLAPERDDLSPSPIESSSLEKSGFGDRSFFGAKRRSTRTSKNKTKKDYKDSRQMSTLGYTDNDVSGENASLTGLSPRAGLALLAAARANAYLDNRDFVIPEDLHVVFEPLAAHRMDGVDGQGRKRARQIIRSVAITGA